MFIAEEGRSIVEPLNLGNGLKIIHQCFKNLEQPEKRPVYRPAFLGFKFLGETERSLTQKAVGWTGGWMDG